MVGACDYVVIKTRRIYGGGVLYFYRIRIFPKIFVRNCLVVYPFRGEGAARTRVLLYTRGKIARLACAGRFNFFGNLRPPPSCVSRLGNVISNGAPRTRQHHHDGVFPKGSRPAAWCIYHVVLVQLFRQVVATMTDPSGHVCTQALIFGRRTHNSWPEDVEETSSVRRTDKDQIDGYKRRRRLASGAADR